MATLTLNALNEITLECNYTPAEILPFLQEGDNFMSVPVGIKRKLNRLGINGNDNELLESFKVLLEKAGFNKDERKNAKHWLIDGILPSPKNAIRLCFVFGMYGYTALDFMWKVCRINGFNFRRAEDVIYYYCLESDLPYGKADEILTKYNEYTAEQSLVETDATKRTRILRSIFRNVADMDEEAFIEALCRNKKNFIKYSMTAHEEVLALKESLSMTLKSQIDEYNHYRKCAEIKIDGEYDKGYTHPISIYPEIIFAFELLSQHKSKGASFGDIMNRFPQERYLSEIFRIPSAPTDKERKAFILLYFASYALDPPMGNFFGDFVISLNDTLDRCGYAKLYPANPYDWLILKCIHSLDHIDQDENDNPVELFNEILIQLAKEETE